MGEEEAERMEEGVRKFLSLRSAVSERWGASVLEEIRRERGHSC